MPILLDLFLTFAKIGAFTFGGGYAMISLIREKALLLGWLNEAELLGGLKSALHNRAVKRSVRLHALCVDSRALTEIERARLNCREVCGIAHLSAERVNLKDEVTLCASSDRGVAGHISDCVERYGEQHCVDAHTRRRKSRLYARVSRSYYYKTRLEVHGDSPVATICRG